MSILALLIYGVVLFPSMIDRIDLVVVDAFLVYYYRWESPVEGIVVEGMVVEGIVVKFFLVQN